MKQTTGLRILLVMSIIYGGIMALSCFMIAALLPTLDSLYQSMQDQIPSEFFSAWKRVAAIPQPFFAAMGLLSVLSVVGCVLMWNLRRSGFHCYAIANLLMIVVPLLFLGKAYLGLGDIMFTALFLLIYYLNLKRLGVFSPSQDQSDQSEQSEKIG